MLLFKSIVILVALNNCALSQKYAFKPLSGQFINFINYQQKPWKAGRNFHYMIPLQYIKYLMGTHINEAKPNDLPGNYKQELKTIIDIKEFDARKTWNYCESIKTIRDQGACGSCWAVAVASVMTDRICTLTVHTESTYFSEEDILTCCSRCPINYKNVCAGGNLMDTWRFVQKMGVVSGGRNSTTGGCKSYNVNSNNSEMKRKTSLFNFKPYSKYRTCVYKCSSNNNVNYIADKKLFSQVYLVNDPMTEIYKYGPITAVMNVYADFLHYKEGVYFRTQVPGNEFIGNHTVKILGWGQYKLVKYWLAANSWSTQWGDKGFFKIIRGENHCNIERYMTAGKV